MVTANHNLSYFFFFAQVLDSTGLIGTATGFGNDTLLERINLPDYAADVSFRS